MKFTYGETVRELISAKSAQTHVDRAAKKNVHARGA